MNEATATFPGGAEARQKDQGDESSPELLHMGAVQMVNQASRLLWDS